MIFKSRRPNGAPAWDNRIIENVYHPPLATHAGLLDYVRTPEGDIEFFYGTNPLNCADQLDLITKFDDVAQATESVALTYDGPCASREG